MDRPPLLVSACLAGAACRYDGGALPDGEDCTDAFRRGAELVAAEAVAQGVRAAVLQARSPSCGTGAIHDGAFAGRVVPGDGVLTAALLRAGVSVEARRGVLPGP
ncbi:DUF523 domain-containing protein [Actinotalea fermentans]|uniref:Uncharacterized protein n=1 Tax=Actinotalea fermentans TaxID=43671 RepID=A0A511Z092_9CELL|nr:DUF523 domain-containing protein [Actinotalea fermentans]KGM16620.1 hypothetical protein N867_18075 [Actinotalea fermentans ATCC 43279 = JCM 9966 = DSM 3133]GEN80881.1 hypothetical protein AFE02nite_26150 [Actinotalea fermentans]